MYLRGFLGLTAGLILSGWLAAATAAEEPAGLEPADRRFDALLAAALKAPERADWQELRRAFAETSYYNPLNVAWREELAEVGKRFAGGETRAAEEQLTRLMERERYMRLDAHFLAGAIYGQTGQKEKERLHRRCIEGILRTLFVPGTGTSFEKPIEVLFIDEEYFFLRMLELERTSQALVVHEGRRFDVLETQARGDRPPRKFYFNIDLHWKGLSRKVHPLMKGEGAKP